VVQAPSNWSRVDGLNNATNMLTANPNINGFYGIMDDVAMGIVEAARTAGKLDSIVIAGANGSCEALRSVLKGELDFTLIAFSKPMGVQLIDTSMQVLNEETAPTFIASPPFGVATALANAILGGTQHPPAALAPEIRQRLEAAKSCFVQQGHACPGEDNQVKIARSAAQEHCRALARR
jgi:ABC-type sugar transport system substrate-binding protein